LFTLQRPAENVIPWEQRITTESLIVSYDTFHKVWNYYLFFVHLLHWCGKRLLPYSSTTCWPDDDNRSFKLKQVAFFSAITTIWSYVWKKSELALSENPARLYTVRWSNFDHRDRKMGVFLQSTEATPCGHLLELKLTPENPPADTMFMAAVAMVLPWKIVEDFQSLVKNMKLWPSFWKSVSCKKMGLNSSHWSCLKACFKGYTFCFTPFLVRSSTGAQRGHEGPSKNVQMTLKDQSFANKLKVLFVCIPELVWPSNFGNCLKMPQR
jgi:hypothetical protein